MFQFQQRYIRLFFVCLITNLYCLFPLQLNTRKKTYPKTLPLTRLIFPIYFVLSIRLYIQILLAFLTQNHIRLNLSSVISSRRFQITQPALFHSAVDRFICICFLTPHYLHRQAQLIVSAVSYLLAYG